MAEYIYTVKDRETGEILFRGGYRESAEFIGCTANHIIALATIPYEYKTKTKYSQYKVERNCQGTPRPGGARLKDIACCDCGVLMENVGARRQRCDECQAKHKIIQNREYMRSIRGIQTAFTPIKPNASRRYCEGCVYYKGEYEMNLCCNYMLDTGKRRPCPPGKGCTVKTRKKGYREKEK